MRPTRVLIVDDEDDIRSMLRLVGHVRGWRCEEVGSGEEALARHHVAVFDVVILDLHMPGLSGLETARRLRATGCTTHLVLYSGYLSREVRANAAEIGVIAIDKDKVEGLLDLVDNLPLER